LDFQQVRDQVQQLGLSASQNVDLLRKQRERARELLEEYAGEIEALRQRVELVARSYDPSLRCALPVAEALDTHYAPPPLPQAVTVLAADGSQINPDRHAEVEYALTNVGAIQMRYGSDQPPATWVSSKLIYGEQLYPITEALLALRRDLQERSQLADLAANAEPPVITFTDGPIELWGVREETGQEASEYKDSLKEYLQVLAEMRQRGVTTAGYVDKPWANLVMRLLEVAITPKDQLKDIRTLSQLRGATDLYLYRELLAPGERSAVFAFQSQAAVNYRGDLGLHFFYLNVGSFNRGWLARVEIPAWVAEDRTALGNLHAVLLHQCRMMGDRPYPYLLHRAHETAVVSLEEQEQVSQMILLELRNKGITVTGLSYKQSAKNLAGRTRYKR
jgi:hypothetical protein